MLGVSKYWENFHHTGFLASYQDYRGEGNCSKFQTKHSYPVLVTSKNVISKKVNLFSANVEIEECQLLLAHGDRFPGKSYWYMRKSFIINIIFRHSCASQKNTYFYSENQYTACITRNDHVLEEFFLNPYRRN